MDGPLLSIFFLLSQQGSDKAVATQVMAAAIPGSSARLVFTTITAQRQAKLQAETEQRVVQDAIRLAAVSNKTALNAFPALSAAFDRMPVAAQSVAFSAAGGSTTGGTGGSTTSGSTATRRRSRGGGA